MASIRIREVANGVKADGTAKFSKRYHVRFRDPSGRQREQVFRTLKEAEAFQRVNDFELLSGSWIDPVKGKITFGKWWEEKYWPGRVDLRPSSKARDESYYRNHVEPEFGDVQIGRIDHEMVVAWVAELSAKGLAPATVHKAHQVLSRAMRTAVKSKRIPSSPCDGVELPEIPDPETRIITPDEIEDLAAAIDERYRAFVFLGSYCGLRFGEMAALRWEKINLLHGTLEVSENVTEVKGKHHVGKPKTGKGKRTVPIPRLIREELESHRLRVGGDIVFPAPNGGYLRASLFRRRFWNPACVAAGLGKWRRAEPKGVDDEGKIVGYDGLVIHEMRHTAVSLWIATGVSVKEIAVRAGHRSVVTVLDRYGHLLPRDDNEDDALDRLARAAREKVEGSACGISVGFSDPTVVSLPTAEA